MKTLLKVFGWVLLLGLVILGGLHFFLKHGLTKSMQEVVLPQLKRQTGIEANVAALSLNIPHGKLFLKEVEIRNPEGFLLETLASVERMELEVDVPTLLKQKMVRIKKVEVANALLNVVRNKQGEINLNALAEQLPKTAEGESAPQPKSEPAPKQVEELPEMVIEALKAHARVRYVDLKLDQLDVMLDLGLVGHGISTLKDKEAPWGEISVVGALGNDRSSFVTDLKLNVAPIRNPETPTFDLTGKVLEIDPRLMDDLYDNLGIRTAPFGLVPALRCREGYFERSQVALNLTGVEFEDKLAKQLGGMRNIERLELVVPVEGPLQKPKVDVAAALKGALMKNSGSILNSLLKGAAAEQAGLEAPPESLSDAAVEVLGSKVEEIGESETVKQVLKDLAGGASSATNTAPKDKTDTLIDILGEHVDEIGEDEELKKGLKDLGNLLFGK